MKRHFKQLLVAFLALTMVLTGAMCAGKNYYKTCSDTNFVSL